MIVLVVLCLCCLSCVCVCHTCFFFDECSLFVCCLLLFIHIMFFISFRAVVFACVCTCSQMFDVMVKLVSLCVMYGVVLPLFVCILCCQCTLLLYCEFVCCGVWSCLLFVVVIVFVLLLLDVACFLFAFVCAVCICFSVCKMSCGCVVPFVCYCLWYA